jgi:hypothetical protein
MQKAEGKIPKCEMLSLVGNLAKSGTSFKP